MSIYGKGAKGKADRLFSLYVRARAGQRCQRCSGREYLQCAHIVSRRYSATRCDPENAWCLCAKCHRELTDDPHAHVSYAIETRGEAGYERLRVKAREGVDVKVDWEQVAAELATLTKGLVREAL